MAEVIESDLCIIGAGSGGLSVAAGASQMGAEVVLIEADEMGGDCLNRGCVPSKSLLAAGHAAHTVRRAGAFGVNGHQPAIDYGRVHDHVHEVIAAIAPTDSQERFEGLGVRVLRSRARFTGPREVEAGGARIRARHYVVATGSRPFVPPVPGLDEVPYLTNETIFGNRERLDHLIVIGGGPIGCEMAQAHRRLGSDVTVLSSNAILPKDDPELAAVVRRSLSEEGVALFERVRVERVARAGNGVAVTVSSRDGERRVDGSEVLVATGRRAVVEALDLDAAGVAYSERGVKVDARLRSVSNKRVYAVGDAAGGLQFTHAAGYHAGIVIRNVLFKLPAKASATIPWVTYTDPELAHAGVTEAQAKERGTDHRVLRWHFAENDRAQAERRTEGLIKAVVTPRGRVLGCSVVGLRAGELILPWVLAIDKGLKVGDLASVVAPYPTLSEVSKRAAGAFYTPKLFSPRTRKLVGLLRHLG